jgi:hypothetical protein
MESREDQTEPREGKKIAIVGFAESSYKLAPYNDPSVEIWGLNELWKYLPRWTRWFELHDSDTLGVTVRDLSEGEQKRHLAWLSSQPKEKPIYMQPQFCDGRFPGAVPYPLEAMCAEFGRYFTSTIGYMLALAISEKATWIGLYGVDLASDIEYPQQRPNTEYLIGLAKGKGITVEIPPTSALLKAGHLYGYEKPLGEQGQIATLTRKHLESLKQKHHEKLAELNTLDGAMQANENLLRLLDYAERGATPLPV